MKQLLHSVWFFSLLAFCLAAITELRSKAGRSEKVAALIPVAMGIAAFGFSIHPGRILTLTPASSILVSRVMTLISAVISSSGAFVRYSRRSSGIWVSVGGLILTVVWMFNTIVT